MEPTSLRFARIARSLAEAARAQGLRAPTFRSPPRVPGVTRTIRRERGAGGGRGGAGDAEGATVSARAALWSALPEMSDLAA